VVYPEVLTVENEGMKNTGQDKNGGIYRRYSETRLKIILLPSKSLGEPSLNVENSKSFSATV
jgi:hypothetical protein